MLHSELLDVDQSGWSSWLPGELGYILVSHWSLLLNRMEWYLPWSSLSFVKSCWPGCDLLNCWCKTMWKIGSSIAFKRSSSDKVEGSTDKSIPAIWAQTCAPFANSLQLHWFDLSEVDMAPNTLWSWPESLGPNAHRMETGLQSLCYFVDRDTLKKVWVTGFS